MLINVFAMFKSKDISASYLAVRYSLEFLVVVFGITVSFWLNEWSQDRREMEFHHKDTVDLLADLSVDRERLTFIAQTIEDGDKNMSRILRSHNRLQDGSVTYETFVDTLIAVGDPYGFPSFFMNRGTYKSLIGNGRLQHFPVRLEKQIKDYYEYVSKRVEDNNAIVDGICIKYYQEHHIMTQMRPLDGDNRPEKVKQDHREFLLRPQIRADYESMEFFKATVGMRSRIFSSRYQIALYREMRDELDSAVRGYLNLQFGDAEPLPQLLDS